jgi:ubiquinone/menaquinone biosynthesis C-methylase UbiE
MEIGAINRFLRWFLTHFFRLLYTRLAWTYDLVAAVVSVGLWKSWVLSVVPRIKQEPVLEIGFGPGHLLNHLTQSGRTVIGLDASRQMVQMSQARVHNRPGKIHLVRGYAQQLPFPQGYFGSVVMTFPAEFSLELATWNEIWRVLAPGGTCFWLPAAWITGKGLLHRLAAGLFRITHQAPSKSQFLDQQLFELIAQVGFTINQHTLSLRNSQVWLIELTRSNIPFSYPKVEYTHGSTNRSRQD